MTAIAPPADPRPAVDPAAADDPLAAADPQGALRAALDGHLDPTTGAEEILLGWLLRLGDGIDPAIAAAGVVAAADGQTVRNGRLLGLLSEVALWPALRLVQVERRRIHRLAAAPPG